MKNWPADNHERRSVAALIPSARNARTHSAEQVAQIAASIQEWGWTSPVLIDEQDGVIAGHGRLLAASALGIEEVPVIVAKGWSEAQRRAYMIADNQLALNAGWNEELLRLELGDLNLAGFDMPLLGFDDAQLHDLLTPTLEAQTDPDEVPEPPKTPVSRLGDLWRCGEHRVLCGDSTSATDVARLLDGEAPHLMVTDPPYGVDYDPDWRNRADRANGKPYGARAVGLVSNDGRIDWGEAWAFFPGSVAYCWHADRHASSVQASLEAAGFEIRCQIMWAKPRFVISRGDYHWQHEPCWYAVRKGGTSKWQGSRSETTRWDIQHQKSETGHSTQKPVECMRRPILNNSKIGDAVYDPFLGSGTTMIAAEMEKRRCFGLEISPAYVDVIVQRWQAFTGNEATLVSGGVDEQGMTFAKVASHRDYLASCAAGNEAIRSRKKGDRKTPTETA